MPERNLGEKTEDKLSGRPVRGAKPFPYRRDQQENPRGFETAIQSRFLDFYQEPRIKAYFKEQTHLDAVSCAFHIPTPQISPLNPTNHLFSINRIAGCSDRSLMIASISSEIRND